LRSETYDALVVIVGASALAMPELMSNAINSCLGSTDKPVLAYISPHAPKIGALLTQGGVPAFSAPESCSAALGAMLHAAQWKAQPQTATAKNTIQLDKIPAGALDEAQAKQLFAKFGISCANEIVVTNAEQAAQAATKLGNRVVLKILSSEILHKSDMGGVTAELLKDTTMRLLPATGGLTPETARDMAMELKTWPLLDGYRGRAPADVDALVAAIVAFSEMVAQLGEKLVEAEINPLFVLERGQSVKAADGIAVFEA
jgi:acyl-CoA synthetase (NDP forming)